MAGIIWKAVGFHFSLLSYRWMGLCQPIRATKRSSQCRGTIVAERARYPHLTNIDPHVARAHVEFAAVDDAVLPGRDGFSPTPGDHKHVVLLAMTQRSSPSFGVHAAGRKALSAGGWRNWWKRHRQIPVSTTGLR